MVGPKVERVSLLGNGARKRVRLRGYGMISPQVRENERFVPPTVPFWIVPVWVNVVLPVGAQTQPVSLLGPLKSQPALYPVPLSSEANVKVCVLPDVGGTMVMLCVPSVMTPW